MNDILTVTGAHVGTVDVDAALFTQALRALIPHVDNSDILSLNHIHFEIGYGAALVIGTATDRYTAGMATIEPLDWDGQVWDFHLALEDAKLVNAVYTPGKGEQGTIRFDVTTDHITVTDVSGMVAGPQIILARPPSLESPHIRKLITEQLQQAAEPMDRATTWGMSPKQWAKVAKSATAMKAPLTVTTFGSGRPLIVTAGPTFIGLMMVTREYDMTEDMKYGDLSEWADLLTDLGQAAA